MKGLIVVALLLSACGQDGTETTARPALLQPQALPADVVIAPIHASPEQGAGVITFGIAFDPDTRTIPEPLTRFKRTTRRSPGAPTSRGALLRPS
jgi:hypothetical protein